MRIVCWDWLMNVTFGHTVVVVQKLFMMQFYKKILQMSHMNSKKLHKIDYASEYKDNRCT